MFACFGWTGIFTGEACDQRAIRFRRNEVFDLHDVLPVIAEVVEVGETLQGCGQLFRQRRAAPLSAFAETADMRARTESERLPIKTRQLRQTQPGLNRERQQGMIVHLRKLSVPRGSCRRPTSSPELRTWRALPSCRKRANTTRTARTQESGAVAVAISRCERGLRATIAATIAAELG
jgi:hypothetical protein